MSNVIIPGESIKTKKDAGKFLKDIDSDVVSDGWVEHEQKLDEKKRKTDAELYKIMKDRVEDRVFSIQWPDGLYEKIFPKGKNVAGDGGERE
jgi:hypothetical protein